MFNEKNKAIS